MHDDVRGFPEHRRRVANNRHAPRRIRRANNFAKVAPRLCRVLINRADNLNGMLLPQQLYNGCADWPDTILNCAYLFLHSTLRMAHITRGANIKESAAMFNSPALAGSNSRLAAASDVSHAE